MPTGGKRRRIIHPGTLIRFDPTDPEERAVPRGYFERRGAFTPKKTDRRNAEEGGERDPATRHQSGGKTFIAVRKKLLIHGRDCRFNI